MDNQIPDSQDNTWVSTESEPHFLPLSFLPVFSSTSPQVFHSLPYYSFLISYLSQIFLVLRGVYILLLIFLSRLLNILPRYQFISNRKIGTTGYYFAKQKYLKIRIMKRNCYQGNLKKYQTLNPANQKRMTKNKHRGWRWETLVYRAAVVSALTARVSISSPATAAWSWASLFCRNNRPYLLRWEYTLETYVQFS